MGVYVHGFYRCKAWQHIAMVLLNKAVYTNLLICSNKEGRILGKSAIGLMKRDEQEICPTKRSRLCKLVFSFKQTKK